MNVIIFYEHLVREWNAVQRLKKALEEKGARVKEYSLIFQRTEAWLDAIFHRPDVIYLPWYAIPAHEQMLDPIVRLNPEVILINQHQEQVGSPASEEVLCPGSEATKNGAYHFAWGEHFQKVLLREGVDPEMIRITGNIRNDAGKTPPADRAKLAADYGLDPNKKWVLFAENRGWLSQRMDEASIAEMILRGSTRESIQKSLDYETKGFQALVDDMWALGDKFGEEYEFIYRPHPGTQFNMEVPKYVHVFCERSIYDWINASVLFLTCESTSIFEAELCGVPCATLDHQEKNPRDVMAGLPDYPKIDSLTEISEELIDRLAKEAKERAPIYARYIGFADGLACQRTVDETMKILQLPKKKQVLKKSSLYRNLYQFVYEVMTFIMTKLGLLYKLRFPETAYVEARDIPYSKENKWIRDK